MLQFIYVLVVRAATFIREAFHARIVAAAPFTIATSHLTDLLRPALVVLAYPGAVELSGSLVFRLAVVLVHNVPLEGTTCTDFGVYGVEFAFDATMLHGCTNATARTF